MPKSKANHQISPGIVHVVLVPGFAGFAALGQMDYYAGLTPQLLRWQRRRRRASRQRRVILHYFPNFPTASVRTRAARLTGYLMKRIARADFQVGDRIALVGHSTGGLDIRRMIYDLAKDPVAPFFVDGIPHDRSVLRGDIPTARRLLSLIERVVFISVPQYGTNIANWVRDRQMKANLLIAQLRTSVELSQVPLVDQLQTQLLGLVAGASQLNLLEAVQDALEEAEVRTSASPMQTALAQEAASELALYLRHIATDFGAINDLTANVVPGYPNSPAHFNQARRQEEKDIWKGYGIKTRSYATLGARPFQFATDQPAPLWVPENPLTCLAAKPTSDWSRSDIFYHACYLACAGGLFDLHKVDGFTNRPPHKLEPWDSDGIVNTASMLWPDGKRTVLVHSDHMDIVGHYHLVAAAPPTNGRRYQSYDLLKSGSGFGPSEFERVWNGIFDFCVA